MTANNNPCLSRLHPDPSRNPFDIHVYWTDAQSREEAMALREKLRARFPWMRMHEPWEKPIGPHPTPMWEADFGDATNVAQRYAEVFDFLKESHGDSSALLHPNTIDGAAASHREPYAVWFGKKLKLDESVFG